MDDKSSISDRVTAKLSTVAFFTEREAWDYFRIAAFAEAIGWTTLISGIGISRYLMHGNNDAVDIAGQFHGTIFLIYIVSVFVFCASLKWTRRQTLIAALASIPPYGTLVIEKYMAHKRRIDAAKSHRQVMARAIIMNGANVLAIQPSDSGFWCLPGGTTKIGESTEAALERTILAQTGVRPVIKYVYQYKHRDRERIEFFFEISNSKDFNNVALDKNNKHQKELDEIEFMKLGKDSNFEPKFLCSEPLETVGSQKSWDVKFIQID
jgi:integral membrane protein